MKPPLIEHNVHEKRLTNRLWWELAAILLVAWVGYFYFRTPDLWSLALGGFSGLVLATWAIEVTGNKPIGLGRSDPPSSSR